MKRVLILGDSISMGYRDIVKEQLKGRAEVCYWEENGRFAKYTLWLANQWIRINGVPDIVHWNNGIWDITREPPLDGNFTPLAEYCSHLTQMIDCLRQANVPHIIFATTTYQHPDRIENPAIDVDRYNAAAIAVMKKEGIPVNDLGALVKEHLMEYIHSDLLHLNELGYRACAAQVVKHLELYL